VRGKRRSGPPHVRVGPVDPSLPNSKFVLQLRLHLGSLEGDDLRMEQAVELFQCLLLEVDVLAVESRLLPMVI